MDRLGRVRKLYEDGTALVLLTGSCAMECDGCPGCPPQPQGLIAQNPEGAKPGELVRVHPHRSKVLMAALMLFALPVAGFFAGYWIGAVLWNVGRLTGCCGLALGMAAGAVYDRRIASKRGSGYTVMRISAKQI